MRAKRGVRKQNIIGKQWIWRRGQVRSKGIKRGFINVLCLTQTRSHSIFALSPVLLNTLCRQKVDAVASAKLTTNILEYSVLTFKKKCF